MQWHTWRTIEQESQCSDSCLTELGFTPFLAFNWLFAFGYLTRQLVYRDRKELLWSSYLVYCIFWIFTGSFWSWDIWLWSTNTTLSGSFCLINRQRTWIVCEIPCPPQFQYAKILNFEWWLVHSSWTKKNKEKLTSQLMCGCGTFPTVPFSFPPSSLLFSNYSFSLSIIYSCFLQQQKNSILILCVLCCRSSKVG